MKKIILTFLCAVLICAFPLVASATETTVADEPIDSTEVTTPAEEEIVSNEENSASGEPTETEAEPTETEAVESEATETEAGEEKPGVIDSIQNIIGSIDLNDLTPEKVASWLKEHWADIVVVFTTVLALLYQIRKHGLLNKSIVTLNNNSVTVAEGSAKSLKASESAVTSYMEKMEALLNEVKRNDEERSKLEKSLSEVGAYLNATRLANTELANEVAELLILANIPNSKKDELYKRHLDAVNNIKRAEAEAKKVTEVISNEDEGGDEA